MASAERLEHPEDIRSIRLEGPSGLVVRLDDGAEIRVTPESWGAGSFRAVLGARLRLRPEDVDVVPIDCAEASNGDRWGHLLYALGRPGEQILVDFGLAVREVRRDGAHATVLVTDGASEREFSVDLDQEVDLGVADDFVRDWCSGAEDDTPLP